jgi:hypothetical protein
MSATITLRPGKGRINKTPVHSRKHFGQRKHKGKEQVFDFADVGTAAARFS